MNDINQIVKQIIKLISLGALGGIMLNSIRKNYQEGVDGMEKRFDLNFLPLDSRLSALEEYTFDNIKGMNDEISERLRKELIESQMSNESLTQMTERVKNVMKVAKDRAITIARTEGNRAENMGKLDGAIQAPVTLKKYLSITHDNRTSPISQAMGEKYGTPEQAIPLDEDFKVIVKGKVIQGPSPPFHPNERDVLMFVQQ